jgi:hypothetical protein
MLFLACHFSNIFPIFAKYIYANREIESDFVIFTVKYEVKMVGFCRSGREKGT